MMELAIGVVFGIGAVFACTRLYGTYQNIKYFRELRERVATEERIVDVKMTKVFLGGTCNESTWRRAHTTQRM